MALGTSRRVMMEEDLRMGNTSQCQHRDVTKKEPYRITHAVAFCCPPEFGTAPDREVDALLLSQMA